MLERQLLDALKRGRTWEQVAVKLGKFSRALWAAIASGKRHATREQRNLIRAASGLPPLEETPADVVAALNIDDVVQVAKRPNTAILAAVSGDVLSVSIKTGVLKVGESDGMPVTLCYRATTRRKRPRGNRVSMIDEITTEGLKLGRGRSGKTASISACARNAAEALAATVTDEDEARWIKQLGG